MKTPTNVPMYSRRRIILINPKIQWGGALLFAAVVTAGAGLFGWLIYNDARAALLGASARGHFLFQTPYPLVREIVVIRLVGLLAAVVVASVLLFFVLMRRIRVGVERLVEVFRLSGEGDLSTPTEATGQKDVAYLGQQVDAMRSRTLSLIDEIRRDADFIRKEPLSPEEFRGRWNALKDKIGRIAP